MIVSERIFCIMKEKHITRSKLSVLTGIPKSTINSWKKRHTNPNIDKIMIIADALDVTPEVLLQDCERLNELDSIHYARENDSDKVYRIMDKLPIYATKQLLGYAEALLDCTKNEDEEEDFLDKMLEI